MKNLVQVLLVVLLFALPSVSLAALSDYFVSTEWLEANHEKAVIVDVRKARSYLKEHIAGAYLVERNEFLQTRNQVPNLVPTVAVITELLSTLGVTPESTLIVYAEDDNPFAARLVWTLRYHGHKKSYVLDGGYEKWAAEDRELSNLPSVSREPSQYVMAADGDYLQARADADYIYTRLDNPKVVVWDTRSPGEHDGSDARADRGGHIPGAVPLNWTNLQTKVNGVKVLKSQEELQALLQSHGLTADKEIVAHCQTGVRSAYATLVLLGLGYEKVKNYDGSWVEWGNNATLPIINAQGHLEGSTQASEKTGSHKDSPVTTKPTLK